MEIYDADPTSDSPAHSTGAAVLMPLRSWDMWQDRRTASAWLTESVTGRFVVLIGLAILVSITYKLMSWQEQPDGAQSLVPQVPIPPVVWFTVAWLLTVSLTGALLKPRLAVPAPRSDINLRRLTLAVCAAVYTGDLLLRAISARAFGVESRLGPGGMILLVVGVVAATALIVRRPPPLAVILAALVALGFTMRALYLVLYPINPQRADNMEMVRRGLERLVAGQTPYAFQDFGTHTTALTYLPWTVLSYLPPFVLGIDIRWSSIALSLIMTLTLWATIRALKLPPQTTTALMLLVGLLYALPYSVSNDGLTEIQVFVMAIASTFGLLALRRQNLAAVTFGLALGSFMLCLYFVPPLLMYVVRQRPWHRAALLVGIVVAIGVVPTLLFVAWDATAFFTALSDAPLDAWRRLDEGRWADWAFTPSAWHALLGGRLRIVQIALGIAFVGLAVTRLRTLHGLIGLSIATYLGMVLSGAYVGGHFFALVLYLMVIAEAIRPLGRVDLESMGRAPQDVPQPLPTGLARGT